MATGTADRNFRCHFGLNRDSPPGDNVSTGTAV